MKALLTCIPFLLVAGVAAQDQTPQAKAAQVVAPIERHLAAGVEENRLGMLTSRTPGRAAGHFSVAYDNLQVARLGLTKAEADHGLEYVYQERLRDLDTKVTAASRVSLLNLGSLSLVRGQLNKALGYVNTLLVLDPENAEAAAMKARIEIAANQSTGIVVGTGNVPSPRQAKSR